MVKRILAGLVSAFMLLSLSVPAYADDTGAGSGSGSGSESESEEPAAPKVKQLKAFIASVDATGNKVTIRKGKGSGKVVNAEGAVVVILDGETARVGTLADLAAGDKVEMWVLKKRLESGEQKAVLIFKGRQPPRRTRPATPPPAPAEGEGSGTGSGTGS